MKILSLLSRREQFAFLFLLASLIGLYCLFSWNYQQYQQYQAQQVRWQEVQTASQILPKQREQIQAMQAHWQQLQKKRSIQGELAWYMYIESLCQRFSLQLQALHEQPPTTSQQAQTPLQIAEIQLQLSGSFHDLLRFMHTIELEDQSAQVFRLSCHKPKALANQKQPSQLHIDLGLRYLWQAD